MKPFGSMNAFSSNRRELAPVGPFDHDQARSAALAFNRNTGIPAPLEALQTYPEALAQYHLHPESKFENGNWIDHGTTRRRHIVAIGTTLIGKEADRWEEQLYLGCHPDADVEYGSPDVGSALRSDLRRAEELAGSRQLSRELGIARETLRALASRERPMSAHIAGRLRHGLNAFFARQSTIQRQVERAILSLRGQVAEHGLTKTAQALGLDIANMSKVLSGRRRPSRRLQDALNCLDD